MSNWKCRPHWHYRLTVSAVVTGLLLLSVVLWMI